MSHLDISYSLEYLSPAYVMGLRQLYIFFSYTAGIDFSRQNLTSTDVLFWRLKSIHAL